MDENIENEVEKLMSNRKLFDEFVYTPFEEVKAELNKRENDPKLEEYLKSHTKSIPSIMKDKKCAVVFVQIATPNIELRKFIDMVKVLDGYSSFFFEYHDDKFTDNNEWKYNLARIGFEKGKTKTGESIVERLNIIDFNLYKGKKLKDVKTFWGQNFADFHHELFGSVYPKSEFEKITFYDASQWFVAAGSKPRLYYEEFFKFFLKNNVLFENYELNDMEKEFTKTVILPALINIQRDIGIKPIITPIQPTDIEGKPFWMVHPHSSIDFVKKKLHS